GAGLLQPFAGPAFPLRRGRRPGHRPLTVCDARAPTLRGDDWLWALCPDRAKIAAVGPARPHGARVSGAAPSPVEKVDMLTRLGRLTPFTGVVFAALSLAGMATAQPPPGVKASGEQVLAFS